MEENKSSMMRSEPHSPRFLASVRSVGEALLCVEAGADVIDCKDPDKGALGALPHDIVRAICKAVPPACPVSATIGDVAPDPIQLKACVEAMASTGVDYVKIGIFEGGDARAAVAALRPGRFHNARLVGLLLADRDPDFSLIETMAAAGFAGVMLDTAGKSSGALTDVMAPARLQSFIEQARRAGLFTGLAGSLRAGHIAPLLALDPDLLGFRGALCVAGDRRGTLDRNALSGVRQLLARPAQAAPSIHKVSS